MLGCVKTGDTHTKPFLPVFGQEITKRLFYDCLVSLPLLRCDESSVKKGTKRPRDDPIDVSRNCYWPQVQIEVKTKRVILFRDLIHLSLQTEGCAICEQTHPFQHWTNTRRGLDHYVQNYLLRAQQGRISLCKMQNGTCFKETENDQDK